jgi:predicted transcriptional regulator
MAIRRDADLHIRVDSEMRKWLDALAEDRRTKVSEVLRDIILQAYRDAHKPEGEHRAPLAVRRPTARRAAVSA